MSLINILFRSVVISRSDILFRLVLCGDFIKEVGREKTLLCAA